MYLVALTTSDLISGTTYVYLHHNDRRMQLSHCIDAGVMLPTIEDARHAMALAEDFWDEVSHGVYITITGPNGPVQSHYRGVKDQFVRDSIVIRHNQALAGYGIDAAAEPVPGLDAAIAQFTYATMYRDAR